jgi:Domain of unknown function (DUF892)
MEGLIAEGENYVKAGGDESVQDAGLIGAAQRVEHYEIAGYGTARALANKLGERQAAELLQAKLDEESDIDHKLSEIAESEGERGGFRFGKDIISNFWRAHFRHWSVGRKRGVNGMAVTSLIPVG